MKYDTLGRVDIIILIFHIIYTYYILWCDFEQDTQREYQLTENFKDVFHRLCQLRISCLCVLRNPVYSPAFGTIIANI